jgi:hypothetical protein
MNGLSYEEQTKALGLITMSLKTLAKGAGIFQHGLSF